MSDSPSPTTVVDRNGTPLQRGQYVTIHAAEGKRSGVVDKVLHDQPLLSMKAHWVEVQGLLGIESFPSTVLEVMPDSRGTGTAGGGA